MTRLGYDDYDFDQPQLTISNVALRKHFELRTGAVYFKKGNMAAASWIFAAAFIEWDDYPGYGVKQGAGGEFSWALVPPVELAE